MIIKQHNHYLILIQNILLKIAKFLLGNPYLFLSIFQSNKGFAIILTDLDEIIYQANDNDLMEQINID